MLVGGQRATKFQLLLCHYSPTSWCSSRLLPLLLLHTKASCLGKRLLFWGDWPDSISSFCFLNIFFIFCNQTNTTILFWYYISCSSVKRPPAKFFPSHSMLSKINISTGGIPVCCTVIAFITSLCLSLFLVVCRVCPTLAGWRREVPHACRVCLAEINRCHKQKNKGKRACIGGRSIDCLCQQDSPFATSSAVVKTSRGSLCRCPFQRELFNRVYLQLCMLPHAAQSPLFETASVSRGHMASSQTILKFTLLNQHLGEGLGFAWCTDGSENKCFKSSALIFSSNSCLLNCIHLPMLIVSRYFICNNKQI